MVRNAVCLGISTSIDDTKDGPRPEETDDPDDLEALQVRSGTQLEATMHCVAIHSQ
jgi:hypothetical protein|eukprot:COSAG06_NODE_24848_length_651_cov_0.751812_1_plen_56_part_00